MLELQKKTKRSFFKLKSLLTFTAPAFKKEQRTRREPVSANTPQISGAARSPDTSLVQEFFSSPMLIELPNEGIVVKRYVSPCFGSSLRLKISRRRWTWPLRSCSLTSSISRPQLEPRTIRSRDYLIVFPRSGDIHFTHCCNPNQLIATR